MLNRSLDYLSGLFDMTLKIILTKYLFDFYFFVAPFFLIMADMLSVVLPTY